MPTQNEINVTQSVSPSLDAASVFSRVHAPAIHIVPQERAGIRVSWAKHLDEVRAAQRLRYQVFADEMGARLSTTVPGHDIDLFDNFCEHLLVIDEHSDQVIGTYRVLTPVQAQRVGYATPRGALNDANGQRNGRRDGARVAVRCRLWRL